MKEELANFQEIYEDVKRRAMQEEMKAIRKNKTWELASLPQEAKPIGSKWVFKTKRNTKGEVVKHKASLVSKGYVQRRWIDFEEVFASMATMVIFKKS